MIVHIDTETNKAQLVSEKTITLNDVLLADNLLTNLIKNLIASREKIEAMKDIPTEI